MSPHEYKNARSAAECTAFLVNKRPYFPYIQADSSDPSSILKAASIIVYYPDEPDYEQILNELSYTRVSGGLTNELFRISGFPDPQKPKSVLIRIFGAEGMIDRDSETSTYASLCDAGIADKYLGRFANGRIEGWLDGYRALNTRELGDMVDGISMELARLHATFQGDCDEVTLLNQLFDWYNQASMKISQEKFLKHGDCLKAKELMQEFDILNKLNYMKKNVIPRDAKTCFCHNDLLAANIMVNEEGKIQLIDFEYGGCNYLAFDIANHFNEFAGGTDDAKPDYSLFPSEGKKEQFLTSYVNTYNRLSGEKLDAVELKHEVEAFILVNHFYWGLWAICQSSIEGCNDFDYLQYAENRFKRYRETCN